ncbi:AMP-binding protein [Nocardia sp. SSK8]|uniref:AMP-binding protein n=1 Tax=Nocardia sp. SSK8 TaxID=3120154 RepID=UPI003009E850
MSHTDSVTAAVSLDALLRDQARERRRDPATLLAAFTTQATQHAEAVAVRDGAVELSYGELAERVDALAAVLADHGVGPETTVAVSLPRSIELVVAVHAVITAGGAFVLLDPDAPADRQQRTIDLATPVLLLATPGVPHPSGVAVLGTDATDVPPADLPGPGADNPAYLVVDVEAAAAVVIGHRAAQANSVWRQRLCGIGTDDSVLWHAPLTGQAAVGEMLLALQTGAALVVPTSPVLATAIAETRVTTACFDPSELAELAALPDAEERLDSLRVVLGCGSLPAKTAAALRFVSGATLWHVYGRPETAGEVLAHEVTGADLEVVPIGTAADDVELLVLDEHLCPVADGEVGELYVSGVQLARGYLGRQATAATFLANPIGPVDDRMFATGDLVRRRPPVDGWAAELEYVGRVDDRTDPYATAPRQGGLPGELLLDEFEAQAAATPFDPAVVYAPGEHATSIITYGDLDRRTNQLARHLLALGIGPESTVLVAVPRSIELVVATYAVLKAGGAVVPVGSTVLPPVADPALVLTLSEHAAVYDIPAVRVDQVRLSDYSDEPITRADRRAPLLAQHPAFVLFPPGATQGITVSHAAAVHRVTAMQGRHSFTGRDVYLHQASGEVTEWHGYLLPLRVGATVVLTEPPDPGRLTELVAAHGITAADFTPQRLAAFTDHVYRNALRARVTSLRSVVVLGAPLSAADVRAFGTISDARLHHDYGRAEATVTLTYPAVPPTDSGETPAVRVREWNRRVYVLGADLRPTDPGVPGELYLAGTQLARGYLDHPIPTSGRFVANPFGIPGERMFRTGELARWEVDGTTAALVRLGDLMKPPVAVPNTARAASMRARIGAGIGARVAELARRHAVPPFAVVRAAMTVVLAWQAGAAVAGATTLSEILCAEPDPVISSATAATSESCAGPHGPITLSYLDSGSFPVPALELTPLRFDGPAADGVHFIVSAHPDPDGHLGLEIEYRTDRVDDHTAATLLRRFSRALGLLTADPDAPSHTLDLRTPAERTQ